MASWMLGLPTSMRSPFSFVGGEQPWRTEWHDVWGFYFEDKWQLTPKLTLNLGMRYDVIVPTYSRSDYCCAFVDQSFPGWQLPVRHTREAGDTRDNSLVSLVNTPRLYVTQGC